MIKIGEKQTNKKMFTYENNMVNFLMSSKAAGFLSSVAAMRINKKKEKRFLLLGFVSVYNSKVKLRKKKLPSGLIYSLSEHENIYSE